MILQTPLIFASIAETTKKKKKHKHFSDYLSNKSGSTIFLHPTDKEEIANIISLNSSKGSGSNSIPYRILFLLISNWQIYSTLLSCLVFFLQCSNLQK